MFVRIGAVGAYFLVIRGVSSKPGIPLHTIFTYFSGVSGVPVSIPALSVRARQNEATRFRCIDAACPLRTQEEVDALAAKHDGDLQLCDASDELNPDDQQASAGDDEVGLEEDGAGEQFELLVEPPRGSRMLMDLWPFAFTREYYKCICTSLYKESGLPTHWMVITTTAHPGALLAAHDLKARCVRKNRLALDTRIPGSLERFGNQFPSATALCVVVSCYAGRRITCRGCVCVGSEIKREKMYPGRGVSRASLSIVSGGVCIVYVGVCVSLRVEDHSVGVESGRSRRG